MKCLSPELNHAIEFVAMDHNGADLQLDHLPRGQESHRCTAINLR
jgi:hypothetical protein